MEIRAAGCILPVKCRLEDGAFSETRLLLLQRSELDELRAKLGWLFNLRGHYQLRYLDKFGDMITFSSEEEFQLALRNHLRPEFRVLVTPIEEASRPEILISGEPKSARRRITFKSDYEKCIADADVAEKRAGKMNCTVNGTADPSAAVKTTRIREDSDTAAKMSSALTSDTVSKSEAPRNSTDSRDAALTSGTVSKSTAFVPKSVTLPGEAASRKAAKTVAHRSSPAVAVSYDCDVNEQSSQSRSNWEALFHPDYLRPRTSTSQRGNRRRATLGIQASLAGYPSSVATTAASAHPTRAPQRPQEAPPPPSTPTLPTTNDGGFVHFGIDCSRCGADPLIGWRFKCSQCPNYNLCEPCFHSYTHGHGFFRLP